MPIHHAVLALLEEGDSYGYELRAQFRQMVGRQGGYRDDFFLKLAAASRLGRNQLKSVLRTQREAYLAELAALAQLRSRHDEEPLISLLVEAAILHMEANLRV